jgi:hypothetical protein
VGSGPSGDTGRAATVRIRAGPRPGHYPRDIRDLARGGFAVTPAHSVPTVSPGSGSENARNSLLGRPFGGRFSVRRLVAVQHVRFEPALVGVGGSVDEGCDEPPFTVIDLFLGERR